jgi:hypothetical protein
LLDNGSVRVNLMMKIVNYFLLAEGWGKVTLFHLFFST